MNKRVIVSLLLLMYIFAVKCHSQGFAAYQILNTSDELANKVVANSSLLAYQPSVSLMGYYNYIDTKLQNKGLYLTANRLGFGYQIDKFDKNFYALSIGNKIYDGLYLGYGVRYSDYFDHFEHDLSLTLRPSKKISIATNIQNISKRNSQTVVSNVGLSYRPFISNNFALDASTMWYNNHFENSLYSIGFSSRIFKNITFSLAYENSFKFENDGRISAQFVYSDYMLKIGMFTVKSLENYEHGSSFNYFQISNLKSDKSFLSEKNKIIEIVLEGNYKDNVSKRGFFENLFQDFADKKDKNAYVLINRIEKLKQDPEVNGILLIVKDYSMPFTLKEEFRNALDDFKNANKKIFSYFENSSQTNYYLLSISDRIFMYPLGTLTLQGSGTELIFYKKLLDKFGINMQVVSKGRYKSYGEQYSRESASQDNIEQITKVLDNIDIQMKSGISKGRKMSLVELNDIMNQSPIHSGRSAISNNLVDSLITLDKLKSAIHNEFINKIKIQSDHSYFSKLKKENKIWESMSDKKIAIIFAEGTINDGKSSKSNLFSEDVMGSDTVIRLIKEARNDPQVEAIIFRINSKGGSVIASDKIQNELRITQEKYKLPVIVSMGSSAASGGYWVACFADRIFANKSTITGSIGVFSIIPSVDSLATELGITTQRFSKNRYSVQSILKNLTDQEKMIVERNMDEIYTTFVKKVSEGRKKDVSFIEKVAEGRVWTGIDANENSLIDEIGDLKKAVKYAVEITGIDTSNDRHIEIYSEEGKFGLFNLFSKMILSKSDLLLLREFQKSDLFDVISSNELFYLYSPFYLEFD